MAAPTITIRSVIPGTSTSANTGTVEVTWSVANAPTAVWFGTVELGMDVLPEGVFSDSGGGSSNVFPTTSGSFTSEIGRTFCIDIRATNADGRAEDREWFFSRIGVGYHRATVPGAPVRQRDLDQIREYLEEIDSRLNDNVLTTLPDFVADFNSRVPAGEGFPAFGDMDYLSGGVGAGGLTDDLLGAMQDVLIYLSPSTMPRGRRPGTIVMPGRRALCEASVRDGVEVGAVYGLATREWVSICLDRRADGLTLLHELFHYASTSNNGDEDRAAAISMCAYGFLP
jgi:hypothetical protein